MTPRPGVNGSYDLRFGRIVFEPYFERERQIALTIEADRATLDPEPLTWGRQVVLGWAPEDQAYAALNGSLTAETVGSPCWRSRGPR